MVPEKQVCHKGGTEEKEEWRPSDNATFLPLKSALFSKLMTAHDLMEMPDKQARENVREIEETPADGVQLGPSHWDEGQQSSRIGEHRLPLPIKEPWNTSVIADHYPVVVPTG